jgi:hypothetical protein
MLRVAWVGHEQFLTTPPSIKNFCSRVTKDISLYIVKVKQMDDEMKLKGKMLHFTVDIKKSL